MMGKYAVKKQPTPPPLREIFRNILDLWGYEVYYTWWYDVADDTRKVSFYAEDPTIRDWLGTLLTLGRWGWSFTKRGALVSHNPGGQKLSDADWRQLHAFLTNAAGPGAGQ